MSHIDPPSDPYEANLVDACAVAGEVLALKGGEVRLLIPLMVPKQRPHHAGPRLSQRQDPFPWTLALLLALQTDLNRSNDSAVLQSSC